MAVDLEDIPEPDRLEGASHPRNTGVLIGQDAATTEFLGSWQSGRMHHAWLITGPRGVGKATLAWRIARARLGHDGATAPGGLDYDPEEPVQRQITALAEPRLALIRRPWNADRKKLREQITVEEVRALKSFFGLSAADGGWRVAIVDAADEMNNNAANALLKILEEPPANTLILLVCHQPGKLLPTIRSRTRSLMCRPLAADDLHQALAAQGIEGAAGPLHDLAEGSVGAAITLAANGGLDTYAKILTTLRSLPQLDRQQVLALGEAAAAKKPNAFQTLMGMVETALHRLSKAGALGGPLSDNFPIEADLHARLSATPHAARQWAQLAQTLTERAAHARAVNLDPAQVILDTFLQIEATAKSLT